ncbi:MAG: HAD family hydrolase [Clostridia bacterium]|nr:HAD family hydrolase [Clostridia bacterium]
MIRMIVSDIDGTLVPIGGSLSERTRQCIKRCAQKNIKIVLASGRTFVNAASVALQSGIDCPVISANGGRADAHTYVSPIYEDRLSRDDAKLICEKLYASGCFMTSYVGTKVYVLHERAGKSENARRVSEAKPDSEFAVIDDTQRMFTEGVNGPYKFEAYSDDPAFIERLRREFSQLGFYVSSAYSYNLEIMPSGGGKGKAVRELAKLYGIAQNEIMALGDGTNDITMLEASGLPVAMENAADSLKRVAKLIAPSAGSDGAAQVIERFALSE